MDDVSPYAMGVIMKSGLHLVAADYTAYSKSVQIRSLSQFICGRIWTRENFEFKDFSRSVSYV